MHAERHAKLFQQLRRLEESDGGRTKQEDTAGNGSGIVPSSERGG
jgi:hypothetical protein